MFHATTIIAVHRNGQTAIAGDGQVTFANSIILKKNAKKVRRLYQGKILAGFAGSVADAFTLFAKFEEKLEAYKGSMMRSAVELAKEWRLDRALSKLDALLIVTDGQNLLIISGNGEVIEPDDGIIAIGSGGPYALAAARALNQFTELSAADIAREALKIAAGICIYTNDNIIVEELEKPEGI